MKKFLLISLLGLGTLFQANAQEQAAPKSAPIEQDSTSKHRPLRFLLTGAFEFGGDEVAKIYFTNGEDQSVRAGQGVSVAVGAEFQFPKVEQLLLRGTVGYKYVTTQADNAHIRLTRVPLHFTANWMFSNKLRIGAGIVSHQAIKFNADGIGENLKLDAASGPIFEIAYRGIGLSYTSMKYKDDRNSTYAANAVGITFSGVLPARK